MYNVEKTVLDELFKSREENLCAISESDKEKIKRLVTKNDTYKMLLDKIDKLSDDEKAKQLVKDSLDSYIDRINVIGSYENDKSRPRGMERYKKLAESLNVNVNYLLSEDDAFIADVEDKYGRRGARQAQELLAEVTGLFAGGEMADEDMREMVDAIQEAYLIAKKNNKKYTPKKYRKDE